MHVKGGPGYVTVRTHADTDEKSLWSQEFSIENSSWVKDDLSAKIYKIPYGKIQHEQEFADAASRSVSNPHLEIIEKQSERDHNYRDVDMIKDIKRKNRSHNERITIMKKSGSNTDNTIYLCSCSDLKISRLKLRKMGCRQPTNQPPNQQTK